MSEAVDHPPGGDRGSPSGRAPETPVFVFRESLTPQERVKLASLTDWPTVWSGPFLRSGTGAGSTIVALKVESGGEPLAVAFGVLNKRFLRSGLRLPTYPRFLGDDPEIECAFWLGLARYCRSRRVQTLQLQCFEALTDLRAVPPLGRLVSRELRREFVVDLRPGATALFERFSSNHRRNIRRALAQNVQYVISRNVEDLRGHVETVGHTTERREERGEAAAGVNEALCRSLMASGDAHLAQLRLEGEILSSFLMVCTPKRAFYFSGGTSKRGMKLGSSHALMWKVIEDLCGRGVQRLTLGGAADGGAEGLNRYKLGFAADEIHSTAYVYQMGGAFVAAIANLPKALKRAATLLRSTVSGRLLRYRRWVVFSWTAEDCSPASDVETDIGIRELGVDDFEAMLSRSDRFGEQARLYYRERGIRSAYGAFSGNTLAHVTWVYTSDTYEKSPTKELPLKPGEAELTNCFTSPDFRGRNIYPQVVRFASSDLFSRGVRRVYMKTEPDNAASQRGISKAGLARQGTLTHLSFPLLGGWDGIYRMVRETDEGASQPLAGR